MPSLFRELSRRNVFKVGIAYTIVAWLLIQVIISVKTPLHLPDWADTFTIVLLVIGFPVALIMAWAFELTPEGIKPTKAEDSTEKIEASPETALIEAPSSPRLAILPFENLSPDPDNAFFTDGLHEEILSTLTNRAPDLEVISRTTMMSYRRNPKPLAEVANELHASHVLEGSVRREGDQVRLTLQLIDGVTDNHLWAQKYDRTLSGALTLQTEVAGAVADQLAVQLAGDPEKIKTPTSDVIAYDYFLKAGVARTDGQLSMARRYLDQAIARDPAFARAYARRALECIAMVNSGLDAIEDPIERNRAAQQAGEDAEQAMALDPTLGLAHTVFADVHVYYWRWEQARPAFERALALSPNDPYVLLVYAYYLALIGDTRDEARAWELAQRVIELDPRSGEMYVNNGYVAMILGRVNEAAESCREALILNPTSYGGVAHLFLGVVEFLRGDAAAALAALKTAEQLMMSEPTPAKVASLINGYTATGQSNDARRLFEELKAMAVNVPVSATTWFTAYSGIGETEQALDWLHTAIDTRDVYGVTYRQMAKQRYFPDLWDNPRFQDARRKVGFSN